MHFNHPQRIASRCKHHVHPSSSARTSLCPQCANLLAKANVEKARKKLEAEGGTDAATYMRDCAWNTARLQYVVTKRRMEKTIKRDQLRQEREKIWEEAHQRHLAQDGLFPPGPSTLSACQVCAITTESAQLHVEQAADSTVAWWERPGALVLDQVLVPNTPPRSPMDAKPIAKPKEKRPSYLRDFIQSYRNMSSVSDVHRRSWEERCKTERAVRRKYDLPEDFEIEAEFFANPIPASHARHHYRQIQDSQHSSERRANRVKRRAEGYKPSRSSLALSELAGDVTMDDTELERLRLATEDAVLQRLANVVATEVGYLYFVGDTDGFEDWRYDVEQSNRSLVYRKVELDVDMGQLDQEQIETEGGDSDESEEL